MNVTPVESWLPWEIWDKITLSLEPKDAFILSSVTSAFRKRFLSDEVQKTLIDWHFHCSLDPSTTPQEQYLRLCSRALGSVFPILKSKIPLGESRLNQYNYQFRPKLKIDSLGTTAVLRSSSECGLFVGNFKNKKNFSLSVSTKETIDYFGVSSEGDFFFFGSLYKGLLSVHDSVTGKALERLDLKDESFPFLVSVKIAGDRAISVHSERAVCKHQHWESDSWQFFGHCSKLWDLRSRKFLYELDNRSKPFSWLKPIGDGTEFLSASIDLEAADFDVPEEDEEQREPKFFSLNIWNFETKGCRELKAKVLFALDLNIKAKISSDRTKVFIQTKNHVSQKENDSCVEYSLCDLISGDLIQESGVFYNSNFTPITKLNFDATRALTCYKDSKEYDIWDPTTAEIILKKKKMGFITQRLKTSRDLRIAFCLTRSDLRSFLEDIYSLNLSKSAEDVLSCFGGGSLFALQMTADETKLIVLSNDEIQLLDCAPLIHERVLDVCSQILDNSHFKEPAFLSLPSSVKDFVFEKIGNKDLDFYENEYNIKDCLLEYLKRTRVPQILELFDKAVIALENDSEEGARYVNQALECIEDFPFKYDVPNACWAQFQEALSQRKDPSHISRIFKVADLIDPGSVKRAFLPHCVSELERSIFSEPDRLQSSYLRKIIKMIDPNYQIEGAKGKAETPPEAEKAPKRSRGNGP